MQSAGSVLLFGLSLLALRPQPKDEVRIVSVAPAGPATRGVLIELTVVVDADLESAPSGVVRIGFNDEDAATFHMVDSLTVAAGHHRVEFKRAVVPVDFGKEGEFGVMVKIGGPPTQRMWAATGSTGRVIRVKP